MEPRTLRDLVITRRDEIVAIVERHGASNVRLFGSVARGDEHPESAIDVLIDLDDDRSLLDHAAIPNVVCAPSFESAS